MLKQLANLIILLSIVLLFSKSVYAGQGDIPIKITISPNAGEAGTNVTVTGSGAEAGLAVRVVLAAQPAPAADVFESLEFSPNADGTFAVSLTIPPESADGTYYIRAEQTRAGGVTPFYYYNTFHVGSITESSLLPTTGQSSNIPLTLMSGMAVLLITALLIRGVYTVMSARTESEGQL